MFDLQDKTLTKTIADNPVVRMKVEASPEEEYAGHALDSAQSVELHGRLMGFYRLELDRVIGVASAEPHGATTWRFR